MATFNDPTVAANVVRAGEVATGATGALHATLKPIPTSLGHYRVNHRFVMVNAQAANSRLFEVRNPDADKLLIPTRLIVRWLNSAAHTAIIEDSIDVFKVQTFTVLDTTNTVTLTPSFKKTSMAAHTMQLRGVTIAGAAAGMTGGTLTKDATTIGQLPRILNQTVMATTETSPRIGDVGDYFDDTFAAAPFQLIQNEGLIVENRVVLGAAAGSSVYVDFSYAVVSLAGGAGY